MRSQDIQRDLGKEPGEVVRESDQDTFRSPFCGDLSVMYKSLLVVFRPFGLPRHNQGLVATLPPAKPLLELEDSYNISDYIYENLTTYTCEEQEKGLQTFNAVFQPLLYILTFLLGVAANGLMITVLLSRWRLMRITEIYLLNLAVADLMLLFTFPFSVADNVAGWLFGEVFCKLWGLMRNLNLLCGSFLLACIGFDRYLAIVHAIPSLQSRRRGTVHLTCMLLWLVCLAFTIPNAVFLTVKQDLRNSSRLSCYYHDYEIHAHNWVLTSRVLEHACFFLPLVVMSYCYTAVVLTLCHSQQSQAKQGAIRLALLVTLVFCFCWLPYNITILIKTLVDLEVILYENCDSYVQLQLAIDVTQSLGFFHCCLNPFLYAFVGVRFRRELIQLLCRLGCSRVFMPLIRTRRHSQPSTSEGMTSITTMHT
ncbi:C-X-C chemokine receptor type 5 [Cheilinus undulatus]|uniref:C-X-C chemokine receptor type 5 n=1 Tax=Cheilinus undulatus TaxID=241271 RepID=UPI001BD63FE2|nr:C-X-C chemokine receptor type 5 [Cheilinus undulatus]